MTESLAVVDHIAISVRDIKEAIAWYEKHFNCVVEYQDDTWAYLKFANIHLALVVPAEHPHHIGFVVKNASKYGLLKTHRDGTESVYVHDPAGNTIEFIDANSAKNTNK